MISFLKFTFHISVLILIIISLFPGSLLGFFLYDDLGRQPNLFENSFGTAINHFIYYFCVSMLGLCLYLRNHNFQKLVFGLFFLLSSAGVLGTYQIIIEYYITTTKGSFAGALIRVCMNVVPLFAAFFFWDKIKKISPDYKIIKWMAIAAFLSIPLLSVTTTLVDRFALYLIPLQLALWPRLIAVQETMLMRSAWASMIFAYYGLVLFVWFNFAIHASFWLPYRMWPFTSETIYPPLYPL